MNRFRRAWMVLLLCVSALPSRSAQPGHETTIEADLILHNGRIFTADTNRLWVQAVAINGNRVAAVGSNDTVRKLAGGQTRMIDLQGRVAVPGINDSHTHLGYSAPIGGFIPTDHENWMHGPEPEETLKKLSELARTTPKDKWLRAEMGLKIRYSSLRRDALDKVAPEHPVILKPTYGHGTIVNTRALQLLGISETVPDPRGGWFERDKETQKITGLMDGSAQYEAWNAYFASDKRAMVEELRKTAREALRYGVTTVQNLPSIMGAVETERAFREAALPVRIRLIAWPYPGRPGEWDKVLRQPISDLTYSSGRKYVIDGTPLEQWALMRKAYEGKPGWYGRLYYNEHDIESILRQALVDKEQHMFHIVGDRTAELVLKIMAKLGPERQWREKRVRFEHANGITDSNIELAKRLGVVISQPRASAAQIHEWHNAGICVAHGSDGEPGNPWVDLMLATRQSDGNSALSREEVLRIYTFGSAYGEFAEDQKGMLKEGMLADLAVLSQDVFKVPGEQLPGTTSLLTIVDGKVAFDSGALNIHQSK